jgi:hypothetical protein
MFRADDQIKALFEFLDLSAESDAGGHPFQLDRGHHSDLKQMF